MAMKGEKNYHLSVMITPQEHEMLRRMMLLFGVRKGVAVSLSIRIAYKVLTMNMDKVEEIRKDKKRIREFFERHGIELKEKDFLF